MSPGNSNQDITDVEDISTPHNTYTMPSKDDLKKIRVSEWTQQIQQEISKLIEEASSLRKIISESKTLTKKQFYQKRFNKIKADTIQLVTALDSITASQSSKEVSDDTATASV